MASLYKAKSIEGSAYKPIKFNSSVKKLMSVLYTQENTWFCTSANRRGEVWQQTDEESHRLCALRFAQHLSPELRNLQIRLSLRCEGTHVLFKKEKPVREEKTGGAWFSPVFCPLSTGAKCSRNLALQNSSKTPDKIYRMRLKILQEG